MASITIQNNVNSSTPSGQYSDYNHEFNCGDVLNASSLNAMNDNINAILLYLNENSSNWGLGLGNLNEDPNNQTPQGIIVLKLAFKGLTPDSNGNAPSDSLSSNQRKNISSPLSDGWSDNYNSVSVGDGLALFMIVAQVKLITGLSDTYLTYDSNGNVWQGPFRVGATNTTSGTGADDDKYNYIYCRTATIGSNGSFPVDVSGKTNLNWNTLIDNVESNGSSSETISELLITWTDHPYGVTELLPYEWLVGFILNDNNTPSNSADDSWSYYFGPICISHWGHNGMDGDGVEYIFYLTSESESQNIVIKNSTTNKYTGDYRLSNGLMTNELFVVEKDEAIDGGTYDGIIPYQLDDFIPKDWSDEPGEPVQNLPYLYVSIRKKNWDSTTGKGVWGHFSNPKLWNRYSAASTSNLTMTLTNDNVFLDDDTDSDALEYASKTEIHIWNGNVEVTNAYGKVEIAVSINSNYNNLMNLILPCRVTSVNSGGDSITISNSDRLSWNTYDGTSINTLGYCLSGIDEYFNSNDINHSSRKDDLVKGMTAAITYTAKLYTTNDDNTPVATVSRQLNLLVINFSSGETYSLIVNPNTVGVHRTSSDSAYAFRENENLFKIEAIQAKGKELSPINFSNEIITGTNNRSNLVLTASSVNLGKFYVLVKNNTSSGTSSSPYSHVTLTSDNNGLSITCTLSTSETGLVSTIKSFEVELYLIYDNEGTPTPIKVDTETVDFSIKGDKGPQGNSLSDLYIIKSKNDNAVVDETVNNTSLETATLTKISIKLNNNYITRECRFLCSESTLPVTLLILYKSNDSSNSLSYKPVGNNYIKANNNSLNNGIDAYVTTNSNTEQEVWFRIQTSNGLLTTLSTGDYYYTLDIEYNKGTNDNPNWISIGTKTFKLGVFDISSGADNGSFYTLEILNDVLSYDSNGQNLFGYGSGEIYSGREPEIKVYKNKLDGTTELVSYSNIKSKPSNTSSLSADETLYIEISSGSDAFNNSSNVLSNIEDNISGKLKLYGNSNSELLGYNKLGYDVTIYKYILTGVDASEHPEYAFIWQDSEHIDCSKDTIGLSDITSYILDLYRIVSDNDGAVIDDLTTTDALLSTATKLKIEVYKGTDSVTSSCKFEFLAGDFPQSSNDNLLKIRYSSNDSNYSDLPLSGSGMRVSSNYFKLATTTAIPNGKFDLDGEKSKYYSYSLAVYYNDNGTDKLIGSITFRLVISDISADGSFYKLIIKDDPIAYDSNGSLVLSGNDPVNVPKIEIHQIGLDNKSTIYNSNIYHYNSSTSLSNGDLNKLYIEFCANDLNNQIDQNYILGSSISFNNDKQISLTLKNGDNIYVPYNKLGYRVNLYKCLQTGANNKAVLLDSEKVDCKKDILGLSDIETLILDAGLTGKMFYMMGIWDPNKTYEIDDLKIPIVFYDVTGKYYYLNYDFPIISIGDIPGDSEYLSTGKLVWILANDFGLVITEGIFSEFAKLGSAIISGDYIMSQEGNITRLSGYTYNKPDYMYFLPTVKGVLFEGNKTFTFNTSTDTNIINRNQDTTINSSMYIKDTGIKLFVGESGLNSILNITSSKTNPSSGSNFSEVNFAIGTDITNLSKFASIGISNGEGQVNCGLDINNSNDTAFKKFRNLWVNLYIYVYEVQNNSPKSANGITLTINKVWFNPNYYFEPNWCVDLKTGKMVAGQGNFVVKPDGSIIVGNGKFVVDASGNVDIIGSIKGGSSINIGNNSFVVDANGNLVSRGTISAANGNFVVDANGNLTINGSFNGNNTVIYKNILYWTQGNYNPLALDDYITGYFSESSYKILGSNGILTDGGTIGYNITNQTRNINILGGNMSFNYNGSIYENLNIPVVYNADIIFAETSSEEPELNLILQLSVNENITSGDIIRYSMGLWLDDPEYHKHLLIEIKCYIRTSGDSMTIHSIGNGILLDVNSNSGGGSISISTNTTIRLLSICRSGGWYWVIL